jgi:hypothetical protein
VRCFRGSLFLELCQQIVGRVGLDPAHDFFRGSVEFALLLGAGRIEIMPR